MDDENEGKDEAKKEHEGHGNDPERAYRPTHWPTFIDFRPYFFGEIGRPGLIERFGVAPADATHDLASYQEIAPQNITFDGSNKIYRIGHAFPPLFDHAPQRVLSALALRFGDVVNGPTNSPQPLLPCESPTAFSNPRRYVLAPVCRAIPPSATTR